MVKKLRDYEAAKISERTYYNNIKKIRIDTKGGEKNTWISIESIKDNDTGLHGYVLQNLETDEIVISFRGTEPPKTSTKKVKQKYVGSPSQDARLSGAGGGAEVKNGKIIYETKKTDYSESVKDLKEDVQGIILGNSDYTKIEYEKTPYKALPSQDAALATGKAKLNPKDKTLTYTNKNQFTEANKVVRKYIKKYGSKNIVFTGHSLGGGLAQYYAVKYDSHAITFAAADVFNLLSKEDQKRALNGEFKGNIISYTYPDDLVGTYYNHSIGSVYYVGYPPGNDGLTLKTHGIKNYLSNDMFNGDGYFLPHLLYGEKIQGQLLSLPLELKNGGVSDFHIRIQTELMNQLAKEMQESEELIATTRRALTRFLDDHITTMKELKNKYRNIVGSGMYDKLNASHVDEILYELTNVGSDGIPLLIDIKEFEHLLEKLRENQNDTGEIAYNMVKMSEDFKQVDQILAQWLQIT